MRAVAEARLRLAVLGSAAGGGLPQWNCGCANCGRARRGEIPVRTQSSLAASADGERWAVVNASPDIRAQLAATPALHPRGLRGSPVGAVLLTNGDIDHVAGLLSLRERHAFTVFATRAVAASLAADPMLRALDRSLVSWREVAPDSAFEIAPELTAELVLFDGTLWEDDEMISTGTGTKSGARMGHMPISGQGGSLAAFAGLGVRGKVYVHVNNTNPVLDPASPARRAVEEAGWIVGEDGMEFAP